MEIWDLLYRKERRREAVEERPSGERDSRQIGVFMKLVTYNTQYGVGRDGRFDLERIAEEVEGADIIALQEVTRNFARNGGVDMIDGLAALLPDYFSRLRCGDGPRFRRDRQPGKAAQPALPVRQHGAVALADRRLAQPASAAHAAGLVVAICSAARWRRWSWRRRDRSESIPCISTTSPSPSAPADQPPQGARLRVCGRGRRDQRLGRIRLSRAAASARIRHSWATSTWTASRPNTC